MISNKPSANIYRTYDSDNPIYLTPQQILDFIWRHQYDSFSNVITMLHKYGMRREDFKLACDAYVFDQVVIIQKLELETKKEVPNGNT